MHLQHLRVHRRADGLFGFGNIAHEIDVSADASKRDVEKREPQAVRTVFKTIEATFEGAIGGYKTVGNEPEPTGSSKDDDEDEDDDKEEEKKKEAEEKKKEEAAEKEKEAEEAKEKAQEAKEKAQEDAKKKAVQEKEEEEKEKEEAKKEQEEAAKKKAAEEAKSRSEAKNDTAAKESSTIKPTRTRAQVTSSNEPSSIPTVISNPAESQSIESILAKATGAASASTTIDEVADISGTSALPSSTSVPDATGTSAGTKAGIAFGVLGGLLAMGLLIFFVFTKRRKQAEMERLENDDEKLHGPMVGRGGAAPPMAAAAAVRRSMSPEPFEPDTSSVRADAQAPRVSLRPVTQFLPNWNGIENQKRSSKGAALALAAPASTSPSTANGPLSPRTPGGSAWERPSTAQSVDPANPFGTQAERVPSPVQEETASALRASPSPMSESSAIAVSAPVSPQSPFENPATDSGAAVAAGAGAAAVARKTSIRKDGPPQLDLTIPQAPMAAIPGSPAGTDYSNTSTTGGAPESPSAGAAAIAAAGGPATSAVHRVQLDFKPTMDDELELNAGDLVRLLHEYDDGWALCIRLDRSRQGVVPRTCLSTRPVKPRPAQNGPRPGPPVKGGPPRGPGPMGPNGGRPQSPMGPPGRPQMGPGPFQGPPQGRSMSPGPRSQSPGPRNGPPGGRPMSPGPRSQSPAGGRSQSPSGVNRRNNPPGPSPMNPSQGPTTSGSLNRKPVPGQAY
ncbi:hypothetical protein FPOAC1_012025 [Fusarium poae]|uniref:hypothetical protein n=1 Tax=Fusarium poae TaxID=36050 RepID=UPI001CEA6FAC|nr:hypothetical protein FPOAC1_012025 [Fusarium poae]KAG8667200.1 hypothetical protein FPOAC1_012025 [Fusarium poae]